MTTGGFESADRGVSDVVGYVLIFSLIVATVGVVTTVGFGTLDDRQDAERINNVERAFDVFANNMENVYRDGAPSRATEMRLAGGELRYGEPTEVTLRDANNHNINLTLQITPLVYSDEGTEIAYEAGSIIRDEGGGGVMLRSPPFRFGPDRTLLPFVRTTRSAGEQSVRLDGTIRAESTLTSVETDPDQDPGLTGADALELEISSERQEAWNRYLENVAQSEDSWRYDAGTLTFDSGDVSAPQFRIQLRFVR